MTALITGASSGIGRAIARRLGKMGLRLIITGRNRESLDALRREIGERQVKVITADISSREECYRLYRETCKYDIDILINNAGFGLFGEFADTSLEKELEMVDVNICALHILTKLFLKDMMQKDRGYILNVASAAGFFPGPLMATYYATKNYVVSLTEAINEELHSKGSNVYIGAFCPGPVDTDFNRRAGVKFSLKGIPAEQAAESALSGMFSRRMITIPTSTIKAAKFGARFAPDSVIVKAARLMQSRKQAD